MFRKNYLIGFLTITLFLIGNAAVFAQTTAPVRGRVVLKGADGKVTPVQGALVEVFRTDVKSKFPSDTTDKKGNFTFAGLPLGGVFILSISGPGIAPEIIPNIKSGMENLVIDVSPGDGKKWTEEEVRQAVASNSGGGSTNQKAELTAEQKKQQAELEKKRAEIEANNKKIENQTAIAKKALDEGNAAYTTENYDVAVVKYEEGFQANPDFVGSAPVFLNNKGAALRQRATNVFNKNSGNTDPSARTAAMGKVRQDLADAADAYNKSWTLIKNAPTADINDPKTHEANKVNALNGARETFRIMAFTKLVDTGKTEIAKTMLGEYMAGESDQAKKAETQRILGDIYLATYDYENAIVEYKKALEINPNDPDALAGTGLSLVTIAFVTTEGDPEKNIPANPAKGKEQYQEAANYLQKFIDVAPATHRLLTSVKESMADLKNTQNVAPQKGKTTTTTKKKN